MLENEIKEFFIPHKNGMNLPVTQSLHQTLSSFRQNNQVPVSSFSKNTPVGVNSWLGGSRFESQEADQGRCSPQSPPLSQLSFRKQQSSCCHYTGISRLRGSATWCHINDAGPSHLWVINVAHSKPSHTPRTPCPPPLPVNCKSWQQLCPFPRLQGVCQHVCVGVGVIRWGVYGVAVSD